MTHAPMTIPIKNTPNALELEDDDDDDAVNDEDDGDDSDVMDDVEDVGDFVGGMILLLLLIG